MSYAQPTVLLNPTAVPPRSPSSPVRHPVLDNRPSYTSFGAAWLLGHGAFALAGGNSPILPMPWFVPVVLLVIGLLVATVVTSVVTTRAEKHATGSEAVVGNLLAASWAVGFGALFLIITAVSSVIDDAHLQTLLWPAGSGFVVGLLYLAGGAVYRDVLQYALGSWLALVSAAAVFLDTPGMYWVLALAGGGAYLAAAAVEPRRRAAALTR